MPAGKLRLLIVDEDEAMARFASTCLARRNFDVSTAASSEEAVRMFHAHEPALVLLDVAINGAGGLSILERIKQIKPTVPVIVLSGLNDPGLVFRASKLGADDYLSKPFEPRELELRVAGLLNSQRPADETAPARGPVQPRPDFSALFGTSLKMEEVKMTVEQVADTDATVLIRGESGTGKEVVARMIYAQSARAGKPFVKVNCAAIPHELLESELFGYEPGAFTGANRQKVGKFDLANGGTIFLDEISEMHPALQAKLLHVLQDGGFSRLGGKRDIAVDVRVLAATNKALERAVEDGVFREDLFYRLNVVSIHIPPLRERRDEIAVLLDFFLRKYSEYYGKQPPPFSEHAVARMMEYAWPGNIRELENLVKRYVIVGNEPQIIRELSTPKPIVASVHRGEEPPPMTADGPAQGGEASPEEMPSLLEIGRRAAMKAEQEAIERVLAQTRWNRRQAARILKISYKALLNKLKLMEEHNRPQSGQPSA